MSDFSVPSDDNPLLPKESGYVYGSILPFRAKESMASPGQAIAGTAELALPDVIRSSINELTSAATLPGRVAQGQVNSATLPQQAIKASLALAGAGATGSTAKTAAETLVGKGFRLEPVEHDPFAVAPTGASGPKSALTLPDEHEQMMQTLHGQAMNQVSEKMKDLMANYRATPGKLITEHAEDMATLYSQALRAVAKKMGKQKQ